MPPRTAPRKGPPAADARSLSPDVVVSTALALVDREGIGAVTLGRVARELGCHVTSLYTHVDSIDDLHVRMSLVVQAELAQRLWQAALGATREGALRNLAAVYREFGEITPMRSRLLFATIASSDPRFVEGGLHLAEPIRATLRSFGLDDDQVRHAHRVFGASMRGFLLSESEGQYREETDATFEALVALFATALGRGDWPAGASGAHPDGDR
ncbi:MAG: TetR family transcriptional regulator [Ilumatobacteraceae bacterium]|nr:TetR family transcriptional regulator [Ilumatobacteraceae bacterium]